ncbi:hypothetical protein I79_019906 [Cricetulus griseus]|uniref:Uncharacterized protein n=1 Tax=Cricetulus griseus TaxID=10029 RepID=G3I8N0_CRIGR|nr:hypothetical protein I79_019906 [Cricetulus griseus]
MEPSESLNSSIHGTTVSSSPELLEPESNPPSTFLLFQHLSICHSLDLRCSAQACELLLVPGTKVMEILKRQRT